ncbi:hypothetical protein BH23PLA1_BH23PLA1_30150 [soil metagenome]
MDHDRIEIPETVVYDPKAAEPPRWRPPARQFVALIVIVAATAMALGIVLSQRAMIGANDISRWCTVWSLLERGTYVIDECPWQLRTQDKVFMTEPFPAEAEEPQKHFYSSKPPLLPTMIAGLIYPFRVATGVPLDHEVEQKRAQRLEVESLDFEPRGDQKVVEVTDSYKIVDVTSDEPVRWPAYVFYFNPILVLFNVVPLAVFLVLYARVLDRYAANDWAWLFSIVAAAFGTNLFLFLSTLNNHTIAAFSAFFALYALLRIWDDHRRHGGYFLAAGVFGAFAACNELPAAAFGILLFLLLLFRAPKQTLLYFVPAAAVPCIAFLVTMYLATGGFTPVYADMNPEDPESSYMYPGSYWLTPLGTDALDEPKWIYFLHATIGHHGILSLTPIFLFSFWALGRSLVGLDRRLRAFSGLTLVLSIAVTAFYVIKTNNYGGSTQGMRWLFWLFPFWLILLPLGVGAGQHRSWVRWLCLAALGFAVLNTGYGLLQPWSHPYIQDAMEHLGLYDLKR